MTEATASTHIQVMAEKMAKKQAKLAEKYKRSGPGIYYEEEIITPEIARDYLTLNKINRNLSPSKIEEWAKEIIAGTFSITHQAIAFDWHGNFIDGQHRLHAIIVAKTPLKLMVAYNCDPETFNKIDDGVPRNSGNLFTILYKRTYGCEPSNIQLTTAVAFGMLQGLKDKSIHKEQTSEYALKHFKTIQKMIPYITRASCGGTPVTAAFCTAALYFGEERILPLAERFKAEMWASTSDPLKILHQRLVRAKVSEKRVTKLDKQDRYGLAVSAIRNCLTGENRVRLEGTDKDWGTDVDRRLAGKKK